MPPPGSSPVGVDARGSLAVQHRRLSSHRPAPSDPPPTRTFGFPCPHRSLWDFPRGPPRTVKTPLVSPRRVGARWTFSLARFWIGKPRGLGFLIGLRVPSSAILCIRRFSLAETLSPSVLTEEDAFPTEESLMRPPTLGMRISH